MATVYSEQRYNENRTCWWRIRVDYNNGSGTAYVDVGPSGWSIWLRFTTGTNTFTKSANIYYASNNGGDSNKLGTFTYSLGSGYTVTQTCSGSDWGGTVNGESSATVPATTYTFNLNILNPDGSEPYSTGEAGSVEQSVNGGNYARIYNEQASSYGHGTTLNYRNFTPGTGRHLSSVSGLNNSGTSGPWSTTMTENKTVTFQTAWDTYTVSYAANGGSSTPNSQTKTHGQSITLRSGISRNNSTASGYTVSFNGNGGTYSGSSKTATNTTTYSFTGWKSNNSGTVYNGGDSYNENGDNTMTAQWSSSTSRGSITLPNASTMSRTYYTFIGWNTNSSGTGTDYSGGASYTPSSNTTLYAKWVANAPYGLNLTYSSSTTNSITLNYTDTGVVTHRMVLYRKANTGPYSSMGIDSGSFTISGLEPDTNYEVYYIAGNSDNQGVSSVKQFSTLLTNPTISDVVTTNLNPFGVTLTTSASIDPQRTLSYQFSNDGGSTWTASQSSEIYVWENLNEETTYSMLVKVIAAHLGTNASDTTAQYSLSITTPADQAKIWRRETNEIGGYILSQYVTLNGSQSYYNSDYSRLEEGEFNITLSWNNVQTAQNIGSYNGGYFGVNNGYYTLNGQSTGTQAVANEKVTLKLTSEYDYSDPPGTAGGRSYYTLKLYLDNALIGQGSGYYSSTAPMYTDFYWFNKYGDENSINAKVYDCSMTKGNDTIALYPCFGPNDVGSFVDDNGILQVISGDDMIVGPAKASWIKGKAYYKINGEWVKAKKIYIKVNGEWKINNNGGS